MRLNNMVAVITGSGSGIGRSIACLFAREGAKVVVVDMNIAGGEETLVAIKEDGGEAEFIQMDVSRSADIANMVKTVQEKFGKIDIFVNNAGIFDKGDAIEDIDEEFWDHLMAVNVKSIFLTSKYIVPVMKKGGGGVILNMASTIGFRPAPFRAPYATSKGAVITLSKVMALELAPYNIRVNYITPGLTMTPIAAQMPEEEKTQIISKIPLGHLTSPDDIANAALFLVSNDASMLTGTSLNVDGGFTI